MKELLSIPLIAFLLACMAYLFSPLRPFVWQPQAKQELKIQEKKFIIKQSIDMAPYIAHEDTAVDLDGNLYTGAYDQEKKNGFIFKVQKGSTQAEKWIDLGNGRVGGIVIDKENNLWACDSTNGLIKVSIKDKKLERILSDLEGDFGLLNDLTFSKTGTLYMTDSSSRKPFHIRHELLEASPTGRLLSYTKSGAASVMLTDLFWPNGLLLSSDEQFIYLSEMGYYRIWKYWLLGPKAGTKDIWVDNLVGFPNGLSYTPKGTILVGLIADRSALLDSIHPFPFLKRIFGSIPELLQPRQSGSGRLLEFSEDGKLLNSWYDHNEGKIIEISSAQSWGENYAIGSDRQTNISIVNLEE